MKRHAHRLPLIALGALALAIMTGSAGAQIVDQRVIQLEEQVRHLTGKIEELNFQMLQLQEQIRRQQEDNEFRLQQLEEQEQGALPQAPTGNAVAENQTAGDKSARVTTAPPASGATGAPPRSLGTLTVDDSGSVVSADIDFSQAGINAAIDGGEVASITGTMNPEELYQVGYEHVLNGDYPIAEDVFERFVSLYPEDVLVADARFWLGESVLAQGRFEDAAEIFIDTRTRHPQAGKAAETMLKIGTIMAALGDRNIACATFADALKSHPTMNGSVRARIQAESAKVQC